jgi:hypothetical protein
MRSHPLVDRPTTLGSRCVTSTRAAVGRCVLSGADRRGRHRRVAQVPPQWSMPPSSE